MKLKKDIRGMTLVETIVSIALLALGSIILVTGFSAAGSLFRHGTDVKNFGQRAAAVADGASIGEVTQDAARQGEITFSLDGMVINIDGSYTTTYDAEKADIQFEVFIPDSLQ